MAKTQEKLNKIGSSVAGATGNLSAFDAMEKKVDKMLDEANAMSELNTVKADSIDDLAAKYDDTSSTSAVDDELAALKAKLGQ